MRDPQRPADRPPKQTDPSKEPAPKRRRLKVKTPCESTPYGAPQLQMVPAAPQKLVPQPKVKAIGKGKGKGKGAGGNLVAYQALGHFCHYIVLIFSHVCVLLSNFVSVSASLSLFLCICLCGSVSVYLSLFQSLPCECFCKRLTFVSSVCLPLGGRVLHIRRPLHF